MAVGKNLPVANIHTFSAHGAVGGCNKDCWLSVFAKTTFKASGTWHSGVHAPHLSHFVMSAWIRIKETFPRSPKVAPEGHTDLHQTRW